LPKAFQKQLLLSYPQQDKIEQYKIEDEKAEEEGEDILDLDAVSEDEEPTEEDNEFINIEDDSE